jgi:excisionase family DNA binding protein
MIHVKLVRDPSEKPAGIDLAGRLALRPPEAARALGLSERTFRSLLPTLPHVRTGGAVLIPVEALRRWLESQCAMQHDHAQAERDRVEAITQDFLSSIKR